MGQFGKLYGIGVGPGDPELLTLKSVRILKTADIIFTAASTKNKYSLAVETAAPYIPLTTPIVFLTFPMTRDKQVSWNAWKENAGRIADALKKGLTAAFITLGDPLTYSTFGYILKGLKPLMPEADIETVPGITSFHAASAKLNWTLVEAEQSLLITSGACGGAHLKDLGDHVQNLAMLKVYKHVKEVGEALKATGFDRDCVAVSRCGRIDEEIIRDTAALETRRPDYWTLILAKKTRRNHEKASRESAAKLEKIHYARAF